VECGASAAALGCPSCGTPAARGKFCAECGTVLATGGFAADRATRVPEGSAAAPGVPPQRVVERRTVSVLFGDLVGFTTLSESRDPEEVRELLTRYFDAARNVVARYGGTIEKFIGDAVMAVWGVPTSHGDDAERAVRAGLDLIDRVVGLAEEVGIPDLSMRVGVVTGEVAVTLGAEGQGMVAGDTVNTAARVQAAAEPGSVWVDDATRSLTAAAVAYADAGEHLLKGKSTPLPLHRARAVVAAVGGAQRVDGLEAPFTGRDRELRFVKELFEATVEDRRSRLVVVSGVAGTGKTRLGWEFEKYADGLQEGCWWHRGRCLSYGDGVAFWALAEMVRGRLGLSEGDAEDRVVEVLDAWLAESVPDEQQQRWLRPLLSVLLGTETAAISREDIFTGWTSFFEVLASNGEPVVMLVEDLQYADDGLLDFFEHALQTARFPLFILALTRPELAERRVGLGGRRSTTIQLEPLSASAMEALVNGLVDGLPDEARVALIERAEGIPLYAVETVRALIDRDAVIPRQGRYVLADDAADRVDLTSLGAPASLQALVSSRLDALDPAERALLQDAAVLGMSFGESALTALGSHEQADLHDLLAPLVRKEIIELQTDPRSPERGQYRFVQAVMRQVAYEMLSHRDRKARHLAVARHLSTWTDPGDDIAAVIAQHYRDALAESGSDDTDGEALAQEAQTHLERAANRSLALGSPTEAYRHYVSALELPVYEENHARLQEGAARAAIARGDQSAALKHASAAVEAHDNAGRPLDAARSATVVASAKVFRQDQTGAIAELADRYQALVGRPEANLVVLEMAEILGRAHNYMGQTDEATEYIQNMLLIAEALGEQDRLVAALTQWANIWIVRGTPTAGFAVLARAVELAREVQRPTSLLSPLIYRAALNGPRNLNVAFAAATEAFELAQQTGNAPQAALAEANILNFLWTAGRWPELRSVLEAEQPDKYDRSMAASRHAVGRWLAVATGESFVELPAPIAELRHSDDLQARAWATTAWASGLVRPEEQREKAMLAFEAAEAAYGWCRTDDDFVYHWVLGLEAAIEAGADDLMSTAFDLVESLAPGLVTPYAHAELLRLRGLARIEEGARELVEADLRGAASELQTFGAPFRCAQAQLGLGRLLLRHDELDEAAALITSARETFVRLGATPWVLRAETQELTGV
jgi:class 3 adenylate cyclase/tetratricopeptide (TPR) repeat protein